MFAISFAEIGALDLSFLSCRAYGKFGMTAVMRRALAVLHALIMMSSSINPSLMSPGAVDCRMNTSSSRTDSPIVTEVSWLEYWRTRIFVSSIPSLRPDKGRRISECHSKKLFGYQLTADAAAWLAGSSSNLVVVFFSPPHHHRRWRNFFPRCAHTAVGLLDIPVCDLLCELRVAVARQELYRIDRHFVSSHHKVLFQD